MSARNTRAPRAANAGASTPRPARAGLVVGVGAAVAAPLGTTTAAAISPATGNVLFSLFLVCVVLNTLRKERQRRRREREAVAFSLTEPAARAGEDEPSAASADEADDHPGG